MPTPHGTVWPRPRQALDLHARRRAGSSWGLPSRGQARGPVPRYLPESHASRTFPSRGGSPVSLPVTWTGLCDRLDEQTAAKAMLRPPARGRTEPGTRHASRPGSPRPRRGGPRLPRPPWAGRRRPRPCMPTPSSPVHVRARRAYLTLPTPVNTPNTATHQGAGVRTAAHEFGGWDTIQLIAGSA